MKSEQRRCSVTLGDFTAQPRDRNRSEATTNERRSALGEGGIRQIATGDEGVLSLLFFSAGGATGALVGACGGVFLDSYEGMEHDQKCDEGCGERNRRPEENDALGEATDVQRCIILTCWHKGVKKKPSEGLQFTKNE